MPVHKCRLGKKCWPLIQYESTLNGRNLLFLKIGPTQNPEVSIKKSSRTYWCLGEKWHHMLSTSRNRMSSKKIQICLKSGEHANISNTQPATLMIFWHGWWSRSRRFSTKAFRFSPSPWNFLNLLPRAVRFSFSEPNPKGWKSKISTFPDAPS